MDIFEYIDRVKANFDKQPEPRYNTKKYFTDNVDDIGPGPNNRNKIPRLNLMPEIYNSEEQGSGVMINPRGLRDGKIPLPTQGLDDGGRVGFDKGSPGRPLGGKSGRIPLAEQDKYFEDIRKAYNKLKKDLGRNPTQGELLKATGKKLKQQLEQLLKKFGLELFNKPGEYNVPLEVLQEARKKQTERMQAAKKIEGPTTFQQDRVLKDVKFPNKKMENAFKANVKLYFSYPFGSAEGRKVGATIDSFKKFYPDPKSVSNDTVRRHVNFFRDKLNLKFPLQTYEGDLKRKAILGKERQKLIREVSGFVQERQMIRAKKETGFGRFGENLDLAHRASLKQFKDFSLPYLVDNLGLDTRKLNQEILPPLEREINSAHRERMRLIKNVKPGKVPKEVSKKLEDINLKLSKISLKTNGALQAVLLDEKTLKPFVFNKNYANVIGQGLLDKPVKELTEADIDFIKTGFPDLAKEAKKIPEKKLTALQELASRTGAGVDPNIGSNIKVKNLIKAIGCPNNKAMGGRAEFNTGTNCFLKGQEAINSGKIAKGSQARNFANFANRAYKLGRGIMKFGIIPEALFVAGESLVRMGMGDTLDEAFLRSTDWLRFGDQTKEAETRALIRTIGPENAQTVLRANDYKQSLTNLNSAKANAEVDLAQNMEEFSGESDETIRIRNEQRIKNAEANIKEKFQPEYVMDAAVMKEAESQDIRGVNNPIKKIFVKARQNKIDDIEQLMASEKVKRPAAPMSTMDDYANQFDDEYLEGLRTKYKNPNITKKDILRAYREDEDFNKGVFQSIFEEGRLNLANRERLFGTQGEFASGGLARVGYGIGGVAKVYQLLRGVNKTKPLKGLEEKLIKQYKSEGMEFIEAIKKAQIEAAGIRYESKMKIIDDAMKDTNVYSDDYVDLLDMKIKLEDPDFAKDYMNFSETLKNKTRARTDEGWAEANFGENYSEQMDIARSKEINESIDPNFKEPLSPSDQMASDIDDMNKANIDEIIGGRKKNATGGLANLTRTIPPERGPNSQGLASFMKNGKR